MHPIKVETSMRHRSVVLLWCWLALSRNVLAADSAAVSLLLKDLNSDSYSTREKAAYALGELGGMGKPAIRPLMKALSDPDREVRVASAFAILQLGVKSELALSIVGKDAREGEPTLWKPQFYGELARRNSRVPPLLVEVLKDERTKDRIQVVLSIAEIGPAAADAVPFLLPVLKHAKKLDREAAALAIGAIGPPARQALTDLRATLADDAPSVRLYAARALRQVDHDSQEALQLVQSQLNNAPTALRALALTVVRSWGPNGSPLVMELSKILSNTEEPDRLRWLAADALRAIGAPGGKSSIPSLQKALQAKERVVRVHAAGALLTINPKQTTVCLPVLVEALSADISTSSKAAEFLGEIGPDAKMVVPALKKALGSKTPSTVHKAALALIRIDPENVEIVPALIAMQKLDVEFFGPDLAKRLSIEALGELGPKARSALPNLLMLVQDSNLHVCREAAKAIARIHGER